jgi:putative salt-induced outer membrane protein YdiY
MAAPPVMPSGVATLPPATPAIAPPKVWEGSVDLGLDGSEGNTDTLNFHVGAKLKHRSDGDTFTSEFNYHENTSGGTTQTDHGIVEERYEHQLGDSLLTCYIHDSLIYDEFKTYRLKDSSDAGLGFQFLKNDLVKLTGRFGGGETYECDGIPQPEWLSEIVFGGDGELSISKLQKLCGSVEYRPEWSDFSNYRLNAKASWEIVLDEVRHLSMKISVIDEYDAAAGFGKKPNDLDYAISMQLSF